MKSSEYNCCKLNFVQQFYEHFRMYHKVVILFDTHSIFSTAAVLENCLETPGLKYLIFSIEIFSDRETLDLSSRFLGVSSKKTPWASISFEDLFPRLTFTLFCFVCRTIPLSFICDYCKCGRLSEPYFLTSFSM